MLDFLAGAIFDTGLQATGWAVMKAVTLGHYRGGKPEDVVFEGSLGAVFWLIGAVSAYQIWRHL